MDGTAGPPWLAAAQSPPPLFSVLNQGREEEDGFLAKNPLPSSLFPPETPTLYSLLTIPPNKTLAHKPNYELALFNCKKTLGIIHPNLTLIIFFQISPPLY
jgi:hypothetical protein